MKNKFISIFKNWYVLLIILVIYLPFFIIIAMSFTPESPRGNISFMYSNPTISNYISIFSNTEFLNSFSNTIVVATIVTPISVILAFFTVMGLRKSNKRVEKANLVVSNYSVISPEVITGLSLALLFSATWIPLGLQKGYLSLILSHISICTPYAILALYPRALTINPNWELASKDLGYNSFQTLYKIIIPYMLPSLLLALALSFSVSFDDFLITKLVGGKVNTVSTSMYSSSRGIKTWVVTFGSVLVILFLTIGMIFSFYKSTERRKLWKKEK
jgi:spermidine/putrescine transport system permease protein